MINLVLVYNENRYSITMKQVVYKIYLVTNIINDKKYIGLTKRSIQERFNEHLKASINSDLLLHRAIRKYGKEYFIVKRVDDTIYRDCAEDLEYHYIKAYNCFCNVGHGYNMTEGGEGTSGYFDIPGSREKHAEITRKWNKENPELYLAREKKRIESIRTPEAIEANRIRGKKYYSIPGKKEEMSLIKKQWIKDNPVKYSEIQKKAALAQQTLAYKNKRSAIARDVFNRANVKKAISESNARRKEKDPEYFINLAKNGSVILKVQRAERKIIRLRCMQFIKDNNLNMIPPDGRASLIKWKVFEFDMLSQFDVSL